MNTQINNIQPIQQAHTEEKPKCSGISHHVTEESKTTERTAKMISDAGKALPHVAVLQLPLLQSH